MNEERLYWLAVFISTLPEFEHMHPEDCKRSAAQILKFLSHMNWLTKFELSGVAAELERVIEIAKAASYLLKHGDDLVDSKGKTSIGLDVLKMHVNRLERGE